MSTNALVKIYNERDEMICMIYKHWDGYPSGFGKELKEFLKPFKLMNGIPLYADETNLANGMGCLAAQIVAHFKKCAGDVYLQAPNKDDKEQYVYSVRPIKNGKGVVVTTRNYR